MKKNWLLFIVICVGAYIYMFSNQISEQKEYEEKMEIYEADLAKWEEQQAAREARQRERKEEIERLRKLATSGNLPSTDTVTKTPPRAEPDDETESETREPISSAPSLRAGPSDGERELLELLGDPYEATTYAVETDLYYVEFSELGAKPIAWEIKSSEFVRNVEMKENGATTTTMRLIPQVGDPTSRDYPLELAGAIARDFNNELFDLEREETEVGTRLTFQSNVSQDGIRTTKIYNFRNDSYLVDLEVEFENVGDLRQRMGRSQGFGIGWQGGFGRPVVSDRIHGRVSAIYASDSAIYTRQLRGDGQPIEIAVPNIDWAGQEKKYFTAIVVPGQKVGQVQINRARNLAPEYDVSGVDTPLSVALLHSPEEIGPGERLRRSYQVYVGPKNRRALTSEAFSIENKSTTPGQLVFHQVPLGMGFLRPLSLLLLSYMNWLHTTIGMWGLAIIGTTITVRLLIFPLTQWAIKNQARTAVEQEKIRPELKEIMKKYKNDSMKRSEAMMSLYREHKINPVAGPLRGCLPMLLQMPIFLALYVLFDQAVELRGQSFLWINDLSAPDALFQFGFSIPLIGDAFNILPVFMGATNFAMMKMMQMPAQDELQEKIQKQMMLMMPIMMVVFLYHMPAGLTLYWTISNLFTVGQSFYTKRLMEKHKEAHKARLETTPVSS